MTNEFPRIVAKWGASSLRRGRRERLFMYECDCGNWFVAFPYSKTQSCGCLQKWLASIKVKEKNTIHGLYNSPTHWSWTTMKQRCFNTKHVHYKNYGGRGITVCDSWLKFENFLEDMGIRPEDKTLDRIDNNGNYEPGNCRWADRYEQARNRRRKAR